MDIRRLPHLQYIQHILQPRTLLLLEIVGIVALALFASREYTIDDASYVYAGNEGEFVTFGAYFATNSLREFGRIPLWQPFVLQGEPALENPISFFFNPFSIIPSLLFGGELGIRYSIALAFVLAGLGGWAVGRVMGLGAPARLLLGAMMVVKGNMPDMIQFGLFQLGVSQAYLPWVVAASIAIVRYPKSRAPVALLAIALALLLLAGNIYYILPACITAAGIALAFCVRFKSLRPLRITVDLDVIRRFGVAALLFALLSSVFLIPNLLNFDQFGGHPNERADSHYEPPAVVLSQLFTFENTIVPQPNSHHYVLMVVPIWFAAVLFVFLPPFVKRWSQPPLFRLNRRVMIIGVVLAGFFLLWGTARNPIMTWAYQNLPLIGQWRFQSRLLTIVSLWIAIFIALRFDSLLRALGSFRVDTWLRRLTGRLIAFGLIVAACLAICEPLLRINDHGTVRQHDPYAMPCMTWLRDQNLDEDLAVSTRDYQTFLPYVLNDIRFSHLSADYKPQGIEPTIFPYDLRLLYPQYILPINAEERAFWLERGYDFHYGSPTDGAGVPCLMSNPDTVPYAFAAPLAFLESYEPPPDPLPSRHRQWFTAEQFIALPHYDRRADVIGLTVQPLPDEPVVVVLQELAWRGWTVSINGQPAPLESVGQLIGVTLEPGNEPRQILFRYDPPVFKLGAIITLVTAVGISLWLLRPPTEKRINSSV